jgi:hypothetical protein
VEKVPFVLTWALHSMGLLLSVQLCGKCAKSVGGDARRRRQLWEGGLTNYPLRFFVRRLVWHPDTGFCLFLVYISAGLV